MSGAVNLAAVGRALEAVLADAGVSLLLRDKATGEVLAPSVEVAGHPHGLLPVFLVAGEAVWREATGKGFGLDIRADPAALLGYRIEAVGAGTFSTVMLSTMEAIEQAGRAPGRPGHLLANDLYGAVWQAARDRADQAVPSTPGRPASSPSNSGPLP
jgi:hypothetical protein